MLKAGRQQRRAAKAADGIRRLPVFALSPFL